MQKLVEIIRNNFSKEVALLLISMLPLIELKGSIPIGLMMGISSIKTYLISYLGSTLPALAILLWIMPIFDWMKKNQKLKKYVMWATNKAAKKKSQIEKYEYLGLLLFVAIPLPGTGVWMGSLIASILGLNKLKSFAIIAIGNSIAGIIIYSLSNIFI
ncbi:MAG: small multi-drug export protein [Peptoniphilaceae bacterium]|nr:small multi-drug export protein [Peptoniphilaceae bacterium]MDY6019098.1 small multi-drug export protein [Anaerococcus sp.]